jgi:hypothetical protein
MADTVLKITTETQENQMIGKNDDEGCLPQALSFQSSARLSIMTTITPSNSGPLKGSSQPPSSVTPKMASVAARLP